MYNLKFIWVSFLLLVFSSIQAQYPNITPKNQITCVNTPVHFAQVNIDNPQDWVWIFEGANPASSTLTNPEVVYTEAGSYLVTLINSGVDTIYTFVNVFSDSDRALAYTINGTTVHFSSATIQLSWDFGDGTTSSETNPIHEYSALDTYTVLLTDSTVCGVKDTNIIVQISNNISATNTQVCYGSNVTFSQTSTNTDNNWHWSFPGGNPTTSSEENPTILYDEPGQYDVSLITSTGDTITKKNFIHVKGDPIANFNVTKGNTTQFTNLSDPGQYLWDFGDETTSTETNPSHIYTSGTYTVSLTVTDDCGTGSLTQDISTSNSNGYTVPIPVDTSITSFVAHMVIGDKQGISNVTGQFKYGESLGTFYNFANSIGLQKGIILSTGDVKLAKGPNDQAGATSKNGLGGDETLQAISTSPLFDVTYIEFDFVPSTNVINFSYVFASEEYPEYVNNIFNDVFGFFISGPGISGPYANNSKNIASIPGTDMPVSINNVNHLTNTEFYRSNVAPNAYSIYGTQYDGFTIPLIAKSLVTPFETYHIKMVIGDAGDRVYDSAVFLKANSFESKPLVFDFDFTEDNYEAELFEDSTSLKITATLPAPADAEITYHFSYSGDAILGEDYSAPSTFTFQQGKTSASIKIKALADNSVEDAEKIIIVIEETQDTLTVTINDRTTIVSNQNYLAEKLVLLSPNPATDVFAIPMDLKPISVEIYTLAGSRVKTFSNHFSKMNISNLSKGLYFVRIQTQDGVLKSKLKVE